MQQSQLNSLLFTNCQLSMMHSSPQSYLMFHFMILETICTTVEAVYLRRWFLLLKHNWDKNVSKGPAYLWQTFCQNHFEHQSCLKIHIRGCKNCKWVKYQYNFFLFIHSVSYHWCYIQSFEFAFVPKKSWFIGYIPKYISYEIHWIRTHETQLLVGKYIPYYLD